VTKDEGNASQFQEDRDGVGTLPLKSVECGIYIANHERMGDIYIVTSRAKDRTGREDESTGAVALGTLKADALANALMKAETKAKRRVTLSIAGLGWLDETEVETIPKGVTLTGSNSDSLPAGESPSHGPAEAHPRVAGDLM
jgi:hypothetical protein